MYRIDRRYANGATDHMGKPWDNFAIGVLTLNEAVEMATHAACTMDEYDAAWVSEDNTQEPRLFYCEFNSPYKL